MDGDGELSDQIALKNEWFVLQRCLPMYLTQILTPQLIVLMGDMHQYYFERVTTPLKMYSSCRNK